MHRFPNPPVRVGGTLHWDVLALYRGRARRAAGRGPGHRGAARQRRHRLAGPWTTASWTPTAPSSATPSTTGTPAPRPSSRKVAERLPPADLYAATGLQYLPFNTLYQLVAAQRHRRAGRRPAPAPHPGSDRVLADRRGGHRAHQRLHDPADRPPHPRLGPATSRTLSASTSRSSRRCAGPATRPGRCCPEVLGGDGPDRTGARDGRRVARHRVRRRRACPRAGERFAYIATGTWSLAGLELDAPVLTEDEPAGQLHQRAGRGRHGPLSAQHHGPVAAPGVPAHLGGRRGTTWSSATLLRRAARAAPLRSVVDAGDPAFIAPGRMPERIAEACRGSGQPVPRDPRRDDPLRPGLARPGPPTRARRTPSGSPAGRSTPCTSSAAARTTSCCASSPPTPADCPVVAGPAEAAALGNVLVQARTAGTSSAGCRNPRAAPLHPATEGSTSTTGTRRRDRTASEHGRRGFPGKTPVTATKEANSRGGTVRVALFVTCVNDTLYPRTGRAVVTLLERLGVEVDFPPAQTCCGQPQFNTGYRHETEPLVRRYAAAFGATSTSSPRPAPARRWCATTIRGSARRRPPRAGARSSPKPRRARSPRRTS